MIKLCELHDVPFEGKLAEMKQFFKDRVGFVSNPPTRISHTRSTHTHVNMPGDLSSSSTFVSLPAKQPRVQISLDGLEWKERYGWGGGDFQRIYMKEAARDALKSASEKCGLTSQAVKSIDIFFQLSRMRSFLGIWNR